MKSGLSTQSVRSFPSGFDRVDIEAWSSHRNEVGTQGKSSWVRMYMGRVADDLQVMQNLREGG